VQSNKGGQLKALYSFLLTLALATTVSSSSYYYYCYVSPQPAVPAPHPVMSDQDLFFHTTPLVDARGLRVSCTWGIEGTPAASVSEVYAALQSHAAVADGLSRVIAESPYDALFFETPPVASTSDAAALPFEAVLLESAALASMQPEPEAFEEHMGAVGAASWVATFANLGGDAILVSPKADARQEYAGVSLAPFTRTAPPEMQRDLWRAVGAAVEAQLALRDTEAQPRPLWVSTSGLGVGWLHVRLDNRPKYYQYARFKRWPRPA
jgi:hypothetical protein